MCDQIVEQEVTESVTPPCFHLARHLSCALDTSHSSHAVLYCDNHRLLRDLVRMRVVMVPATCA